MNQPIVNKVSGERPLYDQVYQALLQQIVEGSYQIHQQLPSEKELSELFNVSRITIRQALNQLQLEHLVYKIQGKGTFVSAPKTFQNISQLQGFAEAMTNMGHEVFNVVKEFRFIPATPQIASKLKVSVNSTVVEIKRIRLLNRKPVSFELTYLPEAIGLALQQINLSTRDVFLAIEEDLSIALGHADLNIDATLADEELSELLQVDINAPLLRVERLTHDHAGHPIDFEYLYFSGETFQYRLRVDRKRNT
ncbi:GntR family transcriptional regulator [Acinetobacter sp. 1000160]|uniref:GntR family transcriptional regulator n=1 Tax=Acinetobacter sp. 1000160 TaxID=1310800 RepID=UPI0004530783|nr:GntR family transcriptional regulator [Acinetobacter sp. 1000160]EXB49275.1 deoR-like helix-turn-helix domain protein [Acinetobacter baumannii 146457]EYT21401.1 deoR-like helix-turn-helix domain protein [Acinetobacter sp. 1000160]